MAKRHSLGIYSVHEDDSAVVEMRNSPTESTESAILPPSGLVMPESKSPPTLETSSPTSQSGSAETVVPASLPDSPNNKSPDAPRYITGFRLAGLVTAMTVAVFLIYLDNSIISTATPVITADLHETADIGWYAGAYTLVSGTLQPLAGKFYTFFRKKFVFLAFLFVFLVGSLICALAKTSPMLIAGRAVAGAGSSGLMNGAWTIVGSSVPLQKQPVYTGTMMGVGQMALIVGPLVGGALTQYASWRWCFYINLPIGACVAVLVVFITIPSDAATTKKGAGQRQDGATALSLGRKIRKLVSSLDLGGFALLAPAMAMFLAALQFGSDTTRYTWGSPLIIGLFSGAGAAAVLFVIWEWNIGDSTALIPGSVVRRREVWSSCGHIFSMAFVVFIANYFLPVWFQAVKGVGPTLSGLYLLPGILGQLSFVLLSGAAVSKLGYFMPWCLFGGVMISVGAGLTTMFGPDTTTAQWVGYQLIQGIGRGAAMTMSITAIQSGGLGGDVVAITMSLLIFCQNLAGSLAVVIATTIFTQSLLKDLPVLAPSVSPEAVISAGTGAAAVRGLLPEESPELDGLLRAYSYAFDKTFYVVTAFAVVSIPLSLFMGWNVDVRKGRAKASNADEEKTAGENEAVEIV
ncbi:major facilitator superfamily domain-containing protein [Podospora didyma]|uniref:Major facilitator superfamily domain-containing protein n=1 Tax=Podospora didyma TaxID=330526 RepID=A0AAE0NGL1_9PEZI|nr:major facilitator superfamily domain-containing protein [Podospora didyma]